MFFIQKFLISNAPPRAGRFISLFFVLLAAILIPPSVIADSRSGDLLLNTGAKQIDMSVSVGTRSTTLLGRTASQTSSDLPSKNRIPLASCVLTLAAAGRCRL